MLQRRRRRGDRATIRILLADDYAILRAGLRALLSLEPDITVVGEAADGEQAIALTESLRPSLVLMDISMPRVNGLEATRQITSRFPDVSVLVLTMHTEERFILAVLEAGGAGYILKRADYPDLLDAIHVVARGEAFLYPATVRMFLAAYRDTDQSTLPRAEDLTAREMEVLKLTAEGYTNSEIGRSLYLSPKTVDTHRMRIMEKLDLHRRHELVRYALQRGLLQT